MNRGNFTARETKEVIKAIKSYDQKRVNFGNLFPQVDETRDINLHFFVSDKSTIAHVYLDKTPRIIKTREISISYFTFDRNGIGRGFHRGLTIEIRKLDKETSNMAFFLDSLNLYNIIGEKQNSDRIQLDVERFPKRFTDGFFGNPPRCHTWVNF